MRTMMSAPASHLGMDASLLFDPKQQMDSYFERLNFHSGKKLTPEVTRSQMTVGRL